MSDLHPGVWGPVEVSTRPPLYSMLTSKQSPLTVVRVRQATTSDANIPAVLGSNIYNNNQVTEQSQKTCYNISMFGLSCCDMRVNRVKVFMFFLYIFSTINLYMYTVLP